MRFIKVKAQKIYGDEPTTFEELAKSLIELCSARISEQNIVLTGLAWDIVRDKSVSNSHSAPEGYPTNFCGVKTLPLGYPGWCGRIWLRFSDSPNGFISDLLSDTLFYIGSGGHGSYNAPWTLINPASKQSRLATYSYDFRMYDLDWPLLADTFSQYEVLSRLSDTPNHMNHNFFKWEDY